MLSLVSPTAELFSESRECRKISDHRSVCTRHPAGPGRSRLGKYCNACLDSCFPLCSLFSLFCDLACLQYYFETIFPRIPKTVGDEIKENLRSMGLPTTALGNAGQGGPDRRGTDDGSRRPASVKASLAVAFGQRAPNRAGTRDQGRGIGGELQLDRSRGTEFRGADRSRDPRGSRYLDRSSSPRGNHGDGRGKYRDRRGDEKFDSGRSGGGHSGYSRDRSPVHDRYAYSGDHGHSRDRGYYGDHRRRGREVNVFDDGYGCSHRDDHKRGRSRSRNRQNVDDNRVKSPRARLRSRSGGRDARDVFKERPAPPSGSYGTLHDMYH